VADSEDDAVATRTFNFKNVIEVSESDVLVFLVNQLREVWPNVLRVNRLSLLTKFILKFISGVEVDARRSPILSIFKVLIIDN